MTTKTFLVTSAACSALLYGGVMLAQNQAVEYVQQPTVEYIQQPTVVYVQVPVVNISNKHGNLRSAQQNIVSAYQRINQAQQANQGQLGGPRTARQGSSCPSRRRVETGRECCQCRRALISRSAQLGL
jgi:hypothetical protein